MGPWLTSAAGFLTTPKKSKKSGMWPQRVCDAGSNVVEAQPAKSSGSKLETRASLTLGMPPQTDVLSCPCWDRRQPALSKEKPGLICFAHTHRRRSKFGVHCALACLFTWLPFKYTDCYHCIFASLTTKHRWGRVYSDFSVMCCKDLLDEWVQTYKTWPQPPAVIWAFAFLILPDCSQVPPRSTCMQGVGQAEAESCRHCRSIFILLMCRARRCSF